jgi:hypothetical protein
MAAEDKIAVNVAKFLVPLPLQVGCNRAVTVVTVQPPAPAVAMVRPVLIARNAPNVG